MIIPISDAHYLVTGNVTVIRTTAAAGNNPDQRNQPLDAANQVVFENCAPFKDFRTEINGIFVNYSNCINITMPMYNLIEYSDNYSDS